MSRLSDYLKVIPKADADIIRQNIAENTELFEIQNLTEQEYENLIDSLIEEEKILTEPVELSEKILAEELNTFYSSVATDLHRLFPEQNNIERLGENYNRIYQGHLEELSNEIERLRTSVNRLQDVETIEENTIIIGYSFEPDRKEEVSELYSSDTAYLYQDRDGTNLNPASQEKLFHTYHLVLNKEEATDLLINDKGITTAKLDVLYESPYVIENDNPEYDIGKAIDGDEGTFWFNVAYKPDNSLDYINIMPGRMKEEGKYVRDTTE